MSSGQPALSPAPANIVAHYEELRGQALAGAPGLRRGLVLLLGEGMVAWMGAWSRCADRPPSPPVTSGTNPGEDRSELVELLANIALSRVAAVAG